MYPSAFKKRNVEIILHWVIPGIVLAVSSFYWWRKDQLIYFGYLSLFPIIFILLTINLAAGPLKFWKWHTSIFPKLHFIVRPLVYTAYYHLVFVLCSYLLLLPTTIATLLETSLVIGLVGMLMGFVHDIFGIDSGLYQISGSRFDKEKHGTVLVVSRYAFFFFGSVSILFGLVAKGGYYFLYERPLEQFSWMTLGFLSGAVVSIPFILWLIFLFKIKKVIHAT